MVKVTVSVGSNCGDREALVKKAVDWLSQELLQVKKSSVYETPCAKNTGKPYINCVVEGFFQGIGFDLDNLLKDKEMEMGRHAGCRQRGDVPIDMDIVIMDGDVVKPWDYRQKFFQIGYQEISGN